MKSRSEELRRRHGRVLLWSLGAALLAHVAVFALSPTFEAEPAFAPEGVSRTEDGGYARPLFVRASFDAPEIFDADGEARREARHLQADHVLPLPGECADLGRGTELPVHGSVRLRVGRSGRTDVVELTETSGSECGDAIITAVADALVYRWLPSERFPAPVDLIQSVALLPSR